MEICIMGKPLAKSRPRFFKRGSFVRVYDDMEKEKNAVRNEIRQHFDGNLITGAVNIEFEFHFERPKSHYGTGRNAGILKESANKHHIVRPDIDNLEKFYMDCLNKTVWVDDCQVIKKTGVKLYGDTEKTVIRIFKIYD